MQSLQEYLIENIDEGKIWDSIKNWFKSLFDSDDKEYSRYSKGQNELSGANLTNYKNYLKDNFNKSQIKIHKLTDSELKEVVFPAGVMPSKEYNFGFYDFSDYKKDKNYKDSDYIGYMYNTKNVSDTAVLIQIKYDKVDIEIIKLQIVEEFENLLKLNDIIKMLIENKEIIGDYKNIIIKEKTNKNLFNQVINDCDFTKEFEEGENIAKLSLHKKYLDE